MTSSARAGDASRFGCGASRRRSREGREERPRGDDLRRAGSARARSARGPAGGRGRRGSRRGGRRRAAPPRASRAGARGARASGWPSDGAPSASARSSAPRRSRTRRASNAGSAAPGKWCGSAVEAMHPRVRPAAWRPREDQRRRYEDFVRTGRRSSSAPRPTRPRTGSRRPGRCGCTAARRRRARACGAGSRCGCAGRRVVVRVLRAPDLGEQGAVRHQPAAVADERAQQVVLDRGQVDLGRRRGARRGRRGRSRARRRRSSARRRGRPRAAARRAAGRSARAG